MVKIIEYIFVLDMEMSWDFLSLCRTCSSEVVVVEGADSTSMAWTTAIASVRPSVSEAGRLRGLEKAVLWRQAPQFCVSVDRETRSLGRKVQTV